jgi:hypothetical protein
MAKKLSDPANYILAGSVECSRYLKESSLFEPSDPCPLTIRRLTPESLRSPCRRRLFPPTAALGPATREDEAGSCAFLDVDFCCLAQRLIRLTREDEPRPSPTRLRRD